VRVTDGTSRSFGGLSGADPDNPCLKWVEHPEPWVIEPGLIRELRPPLNLAENSHHPFCERLARIRSEAKARARSLEVLADGFKL
jgi:hypothetical protein